MRRIQPSTTVDEITDKITEIDITEAGRPGNQKKPEAKTGRKSKVRLMYFCHNIHRPPFHRFPPSLLPSFTSFGGVSWFSGILCLLNLYSSIYSLASLSDVTYSTSLAKLDISLAILSDDVTLPSYLQTQQLGRKYGDVFDRLHNLESRDVTSARPSSHCNHWASGWGKKGA